MKEMQKIDNLISVCEKKDLETWRIASGYIVKFIDSKKYSVIVPESQVELFRANTSEKFLIESENHYIKDLSVRLAPHTQQSNDRHGWYLQQFIKIAALSATKKDELSLIWDADTIPLKKLSFSDGRVVSFYTGHENHKPYFETVNRLLGYGKKAPFSFISQCFPCRGYWIKSFISYLEDNYAKSWVDCLIDAIDFSEPSSFSEYETIGTFVLMNYPEEIVTLKREWSRLGNGMLGSPKNVKYLRTLIARRYDFIAFEDWDRPWSSHREKLSTLVPRGR